MIQLDLHRGSDLKFSLKWYSGPDEESPPADIRGHTIEVFEPSEELRPYLAVNIGDGLNGEINGRITWSNTFSNGRNMSFILRKFDGTNWVALPRTTVNVIG